MFRSVRTRRRRFPLSDLIGRRAYDAMAIAGIVLIIGGLALFYRSPESPKSSVLGTRYASPSPTPSPSETPAPSPSPFDFGDLVLPVDDSAPGVSKATTKQKGSSKRPTRVVVAGRRCRNSVDPKCGPFYWDPRPDADQALEISVSWSPGSPKAGEEVTFVMTARDPDAEIRRTATGYGDTSRRPSLTPCHRTRYGAWTPPAKEPGFFQQTYVHAYATAGTFTATFSALSGGCDSPYGQVMSQPVRITIAAPPPTPPYLTIFFGRSQLEPTYGAECNSYTPGKTKTLFDAAAFLKSKGIHGVGGVVTDRTGDAANSCDSITKYPTWTDLAQLRDEFGMVFVSQSKTYTGMREATTEEQFRRESCDTLPTFEQHGHYDAWGMFAYPSGQQNPDSFGVINSCFSFLRRYGQPPTGRYDAAKAPHVARTLSVAGGACNNPDLPCYGLQTPKRYMLPSEVAAAMRPGQDQYSIVQFYRFVEGSNSTEGTERWDCSGSDARSHWTKRTEIYCWVDFQAAVSGRSGNAVVTDPATVGTAWNLIPPNRR